jgi:uncharacterized protein YciI
MSIFAVRYTYADDEARMAEVRPQHRDYLGELYEAGQVLIAGPLLPPPGGGLLLVNVADAAAAKAIADGDPLMKAGLIVAVDINEWIQIFGPLAV